MNTEFYLIDNSRRIFSFSIAAMYIIHHVIISSVKTSTYITYNIVMYTSVSSHRFIVITWYIQHCWKECKTTVFRWDSPTGFVAGWHITPAYRYNWSKHRRGTTLCHHSTWISFYHRKPSTKTICVIHFTLVCTCLSSLGLIKCTTLLLILLLYLNYYTWWRNSVCKCMSVQMSLIIIHVAV